MQVQINRCLNGEMDNTEVKCTRCGRLGTVVAIEDCIFPAWYCKQCLEEAINFLDAALLKEVSNV